MGATTLGPAMVALQLLHGFTFGVFMVASVTWLNRIVPGRLRASAQALFASAVYGLGGVVGYLAFGELFDLMPARGLFFVAACLEALPLALVFLLPSRAPTGAATVLGSTGVPP
jgi:PPP family 3-phenylpropionic acid transporter